MKKIMIAGLGLALMTASCQNEQQNASAVYESMVKKSLDVKDYVSAITGIQLLVAADSSKQHYLDSLPELYVAVRNTEAAEVYTDRALKSRPTDEKLLQMKAVCLENKGDYPGTLDIMNKLYATTQKLSYLYQVTAIQFQGGDGENAVKGLKTLEEKMDGSKDSVEFLISQNEKQKVPLRPAVLHLKAYMTAQSGDLMSAKTLWEKALKEYPEFMAAREAYMQLMQRGRR